MNLKLNLWTVGLQQDGYTNYRCVPNSKYINTISHYNLVTIFYKFLLLECSNEKLLKVPIRRKVHKIDYKSIKNIEFNKKNQIVLYEDENVFFQKIKVMGTKWQKFGDE